MRVAGRSSQSRSLIRPVRRSRMISSVSSWTSEALRYAIPADAGDRALTAPFVGLDGELRVACGMVARRFSPRWRLVPKERGGCAEARQLSSAELVKPGDRSK